MEDEIDNQKIRVIVIVGPTACGKTKLSIELAKIFNGEIISADSIQVYKKMNIGTAKPTKLEMGNVPHHLIDFLNVEEEFSVSDYIRLAKICISEITRRGKIPFVVGGTGLYVNSLIDNVYFQVEKKDPELRRFLNEKLKTKGITALLKELATFDKESAERIHPNNTIRIIRAIEIYKTTGITMTEHIANSKKIESNYDPIFIGLAYRDRSFMYAKINRRVDKMIDSGLIDEAKEILSLHCSKTAMNAICYKELIPYFNNQCSLSDAIEKIKLNTRKYAKRQLTWFKRDPRINWIFVDEYSNFYEILNCCVKIIECFKYT